MHLINAITKIFLHQSKKKKMSKKINVDFKGVAIKMAGHAAGAAAFTQLNKLKFMQNFTPEKQGIKGLITAAIGYLGVPFIAEKAGLTGKGKGEFINNVGEGIGLV